MGSILEQGVLPASGQTSIRLIARPGAGPLSVELTLEPHVYLHFAELVQDVGAHGMTIPQAYKNESSVVWRQIEARAPDSATIAFDISWLAIANAAPGAFYTAIVTVRDAHCDLLDGDDMFGNPTRARGQIGPASNPTDIGRLDVLVSLPPGQPDSAHHISARAKS